MPGSNLEEQVAGLVVRLREAKQLFENSENSGFSGVLASVNAAVEFVRCLEPVVREELDIPLRMLISALIDVDRGKPSPLLECRNPGQRVADDMRTQAIRAHAGFIMGRLMDRRLMQAGHFKRKDAARKVAAVLVDAGFKVGNDVEKPAWETVASWRDGFNKRGAKGDDVDVYRALEKKGLPIPEGTAPADVARLLLAFLDHTVRSTMPRTN